MSATLVNNGLLKSDRQIANAVGKYTGWPTKMSLFLEQNRTLEYLRHNFPWDMLISRKTDNPWSFYPQDLNPLDYFLRGYLKVSVCENNPQTREDIIRK